AQVRFDHSFAPGFQEKIVTVMGRDHLVSSGNPARTSDGLVYSFQVTRNGSGLVLNTATPLDKTLMPEERRILDTQERGAFPNLLSNYEVLDHSTKHYSYNCIAWSIGITDRWVWPGAKMSDFDRLYGSHGYERVSDMDMTVKRDVHKLVLYGNV